FPSCEAFIHALEPAGAARPRVASVIAPFTGASDEFSPASLVLAEVIRRLGGPARAEAEAGLPGALLRRTLASRLLCGEVGRWVGGFLQQWQGLVLREEAEEMVLGVAVPRSFWPRYGGRDLGLEVRLAFGVSAGRSGKLTDMDVQIRPTGCDGE